MESITAQLLLGRLSSLTLTRRGSLLTKTVLVSVDVLGASAGPGAVAGAVAAVFPGNGLNGGGEARACPIAARHDLTP